MWIEILQNAQVCPSEVFNLGSKIAEACKNVGTMTFSDFIGSDCMQLVGAVLIAPFIEAVQDAMDSWNLTHSTPTPTPTPTSSSAEDVTLAELLGEEQLTLADVVGK